MRNIGPVSRGWLREVGIENLRDLEKVGALDAYRKVRAIQPEASLNLLYALQGALMDTNWQELPTDLLEALREAIEQEQPETT